MSVTLGDFSVRIIHFFFSVHMPEHLSPAPPFLFASTVTFTLPDQAAKHKALTPKTESTQVHSKCGRAESGLSHNVTCLYSRKWHFYGNHKQHRSGSHARGVSAYAVYGNSERTGALMMNLIKMRVCETDILRLFFWFATLFTLLTNDLTCPVGDVWHMGYSFIT